MLGGRGDEKLLRMMETLSLVFGMTDPGAKLRLRRSDAPERLANLEMTAD
jgi:hypothetical protein